MTWYVGSKKRIFPSKHLLEAGLAEHILAFSLLKQPGVEMPVETVK